jgi:peptide/nickel transport system substrate-binding protein
VKPWRLAVALLLGVLTAGCVHRATADPGVIIVSLATAPNNLDPRMATDDVSIKIHQLIFDNFIEVDDRLRVVPKLAESLEHPDPLTYVARVRRGVRFHDGHELTADDVVFTFGRFLDLDFVSPRKGGYRELESVTARDPYTVVFTLNRPYVSFPINLMMPIVEKGAGPELSDLPIGTGPYRFQRYAADDRIELTPNREYWDGPPRNNGLVLRIVPDDVMRGLELEKGTLDLVVNDLAPDIVYQLRQRPAMQVVESPGVDYQYIGLNVRDPLLRDVRIRQAIAYAVDRDAIVRHLRRGLATPASGFLPRLSWAAGPVVVGISYDPALA